MKAMFSNQEKLTEVEAIIEAMRQMPGSAETQERICILGAIASDFRARLDAAPTIALTQIERRITSAMRHKTALGYENGTMVGIAEEVIGRWAVVKQALEKFGEEP